MQKRWKILRNTEIENTNEAKQRYIHGSLKVTWYRIYQGYLLSFWHTEEKHSIYKWTTILFKKHCYERVWLSLTDSYQGPLPEERGIR
jgi:hypothetical protein